MFNQYQKIQGKIKGLIFFVQNIVTIQVIYAKKN